MRTWGEVLARRPWIIGPVLAVVVAIAYFAWPRDYCRSAERSFGIRVPVCPDGDVRPVAGIRAYGLKRGGAGEVAVSLHALYTTAEADHWDQAVVERFDVRLALVGADGAETPIAPKEKWDRRDTVLFAMVELPEVADGDYHLRAVVTSKSGEAVVELPLALYAPARIHVLTDRPLYEPGHEVLFRAVVLRARDLAPIDHRPGKWIVRDPSGEILLEEHAGAGEWGVVAGSFPLAPEASEGRWTVTWASGEQEGAAEFTVEPFTLPRFRIEAAPGRPFYGRLDQPRLAGAVVYSSGAPVAGARVQASWTVVGDWPPPTSWNEGALPVEAAADAAGRFSFELPEVPSDLVGRVTLAASLSAVDPAGDRVAGSASILLSEDRLRVETVTELGGGLVPSFNNRLYLRVATADGRVLPGAAVRVRRAWAPEDDGIDAETDADGVARIQIDPGAPVNVVIPPRPVRRQTTTRRAVTRTGANELLSRARVPLGDLAAMDGWLGPLAACGVHARQDSESVTIALRVDPAGAAVTTAGSEGPLGNCAVGVLARSRLPRGDDRLYVLQFSFAQPELSRVDVAFESPLGLPSELGDLKARFEAAARAARACMPPTFEGEASWPLEWRVAAGSRAVTTSWVRRGSMQSAVADCLAAPLRGLQVDEPTPAARFGVVRYTVHPHRRPEERAPQPTVIKGYELLVSAEVDGEPIGETRLRLAPGDVPPLRLRAIPVVAQPGDEVEVSLIRGPTFSGELPKEIEVLHFGDRERIDVDEDRRAATLTIPGDARGWYEITAPRFRDARALVFVRSGGELRVEVAPDAGRYQPGATARLAVLTEAGGVGAPAAVGLFGVDETMSQLAPLPGPDELGGLRPPIVMSEPAFGVLEGQALALGRIRGEHAAAATVLRVASVPTPEEIDAVVHGTADTHIDPVAELVERFYPILEEAHRLARAWERTAPAGETMTPATMAALWREARDAVAARGERVDDAFGRPLRLHLLPRDLLELTDPRQLVVVGTRLPEDVENWAAWVARERPR